jgi:hypothetical protein
MKKHNVTAKVDTTFLKGALLSVEKKFRSDLAHKREINTHSPSFGDATEDAWIELLREYLPNRYKVNKAFAVDHRGNVTEQLDCVIYDAHFTPKLFGEDRRLYVPVEAVYGTFEIKQDIDASHMSYAAKKIASLRKLVRTSVALQGPKGPNEPRVPQPMIGGLLAMKASWSDGLGSKFLDNLKSYNGEEQFDFVLTAESGFFDALDPALSPSVVSGDGALMRGLFRLIKALRDKNSVPAVDWEKYEEALGIS